MFVGSEEPSVFREGRCHHRGGNAMATSGRVEVEFEYAPKAGDSELGSTPSDGIALGIVLELSAHAVSAALPGFGLQDLRFGPPLRLNGPRRCLAAVDPSARSIQVSSCKPGVPEQPVVHLVGRLARFDEN